MDNRSPKTIHLSYYAILKDERGIASETIETSANTARELYHDLQEQHDFRLTEDSLKVSINDTFSSWQEPLKTGDHVVFIPPVAGG